MSCWSASIFGGAVAGAAGCAMGMLFSWLTRRGGYSYWSVQRLKRQLADAIYERDYLRRRLEEWTKRG